MSPDQLVAQNLERWKEHLLDTSKRNRLLYFQPTSAVQLVEPDMETLWQRLVSGSKTLTFFGQDAEGLAQLSDSESESEDDDSIVLPQRSLKSDEILTSPGGPKLNRLLYGLRSKSNLSLEEQGLTTLYVAWGFLRWRDSRTGDEISSPLILAPMTLLRESSKASYRIKLSEEDLWLNPVLDWKLASDYRIELPALPPFEDTNPFEYFDQVREVIAKQKGWSVWEAAYLGLFSFHKMAMYQDLREGEALAQSNPFVRALGGDPSLLPELPEALPRGESLDNLRIRESFGVLDCDSSQSESVQAAQAGVSFVLQGPPGTGKSQTITNIIAHSLAQGKRVLFVSEKMAALDVVHSRLQNVGLGLFCLKAHSQSATKKEVISDLGKTLAAARTGTELNNFRMAARQDESESSELERLRAGLNHYARELHQIRSPLEKSVYQVTGELAVRPNAAEVVVPLPSPFEMETETLERLRELLEAAQSSEGAWSQGAAHPWYGALPRPFSMDLIATVRSRAGNALALSRELERSGRAMAARCGVTVNPLSLDRAEKLPVLHQLLGQLEAKGARRPPAMWFVLDDLEGHLALAAQFKSRYSSVKRRRGDLDQIYGAPFWELPHQELIERATTRHEAVLARGGTWEAFPSWSSEVIERQGKAASHLETATRTGLALAGSLGLPLPQNLTELGTFCNALLALQFDFVGQQRVVGASWLEAGQLPTLKLDAQAARQQARSRDEAEKQLGGYNLEAMKGAELAAMSGRFEQNYTGFFRFLKGDYRRDMAQLAQWRADGSKPDYMTARADLQTAVRWQQCVQWQETSAPQHLAQFGAAFVGKDTGWEGIEADLVACERVVTAFVPLGGLGAELVRRLASRDDLTASLANLPILVNSLSALREELPWLQAVFSLDNLPFKKDEVSLSFAQAPALLLVNWLREQSLALTDVQAAFGSYLSLRSDGENTPATLIAHGNEALRVLQFERELEGEEEGLRRQFATLFDGMDTDWDALIAALSWTSQAIAWWKSWAALGGEAGEDGQALGDFVAIASGEKAFSGGSDELPSVLPLREEWRYFASLFEAGVQAGATLDDDEVWFQGRIAHAAQLENMLRWLDITREMQSSGLAPFWEAARRLGLKGKALTDAFERRFWSLWIDGALSESPVLRDFDGVRHSSSTARFVSLDAGSLEAAQRRLGELLWEKKPISSTGSARTGEISTLQKEVNKKARQKPLRRLFREIPHLLGALKPCILMSPLAVAQFLEAGRSEFDLVIFDEASQILPEDAVGAILRSKQIVVVGDRKQLPPTRFFASGGVTDSDEEEENDDDSSLYESILDMCSPHLPNYMLLWHYRSRHEALISFSNRNFYDGRLITFPSPYQGGVYGRGVRLESVAGTYYRGKGKDARTNPIEAGRVADLVIEHFERSPHQSLGVIALNATQARAIDEALTQRLTLRPELEEYASPHRKERFFIKALENVQGDERDVILLSIGFGPDSEGKISMNFGPLNKPGGERRLNVAVTRARDALTVVSSLQSEQIDTARTTMVGPRLLRSYLEMARRGGDFAALDGGLNTEKLVDAVDEALTARGWKTQRGVGSSALRLDVAVEHPTEAGKFLMGIECDGLDYRSAPTARDRERLRPAVLRGLGWKLERVWSLDWLKNPAAELDRLERELERAQGIYPEEIVEEIPKEEVEAEATGAVELVLEEPNWVVGEGDISMPDVDAEPLAVYREVDLGYRGSPEDFRALNTNSPQLRNAIWRVVEVEGPIRIETLQQRVGRAWGFKRMGDIVSGTILLALDQEPRVRRQGLFVWRSDQQTTSFRVPRGNDSPRPIDSICPEEIGAAALHCVREAYGLEKEELVRQTARLLGYARTGLQVETAIRAAVQLLLDNERLVELGGAIGLGDSEK